MLPALQPSLGPWRPKDPTRAVAVLMSGGVDSSVTALLLREAGLEVAGFTMRIPIPPACRNPRLCCGEEAVFVCSRLGIPHFFLETEDLFRREVIDAFRRDYAAGRTPSPCVDCNAKLKFGAVWDAIEADLGIRRLATGHYARIEGGALFRGADRERDQSYFLYGIPAARLPDLLLPIGAMSKTETRQRAREAGLTSAERPDSMELCFAGEGDYRLALGDAMPGPGPILDTAGRERGRHRGIHLHTVGQRRGLGLSSPEPLHVLRLDPARNAVIVGRREEALAERVEAAQPNVLAPDLLGPGARLSGRIRSGGEPSPCRILAGDGNRLSVRFDPPVFAPTPGQHLVLYASDQVAAGGVIVQSDLSAPAIREGELHGAHL